MVLCTRWKWPQKKKKKNGETGDGMVGGGGGGVGGGVLICRMLIFLILLSSENAQAFNKCTESAYVIDGPAYILHVKTVSELLTYFHDFAHSQWGTAVTEISPICWETRAEKCSPFFAWSRSEHSHACFAHCQEFLSCNFYLDGLFIFLFSQSSPYFLSALVLGGVFPCGNFPRIRMCHLFIVTSNLGRFPWWVLTECE